MKWSRVALLSAFAAPAAAWSGEIVREFEHFVNKFEKTYDSILEKEARLKAFAENYLYIQAENAKGHSYELGINEFADMTSDEFALTHLGLEQPKNMWGDLPNLGTHLYSGAPLPKSVDWRQKGAVNPVKNQAQCGSCWAFSTIQAIEGAWQIATGKLLSLSEQQLVDCAKSFGNQGCNGGLMDNGFKYAKQAALCTEESYPYKGKNGICQAQSCTNGIPNGGVTGYKDVNPMDTNALMEAVAQQPVAIAIEADKMVFQLYKGGVLNATCGTKLDHGVGLDGYGTENGQDYWLVRNSWGPSWGEKGYIKLLRGKPGAGECGLKSQPSYPVVSGKPGPSPGPSPPPAPPAPPAPPSPSTAHYEKPPCQAGEAQAALQGKGEVCAPPCQGTSCPTDVPAGTTATPKCMLQDQSGNHYCALSCWLSAGCPKGATCARIGGVKGVCVYPSSGESLPLLTVTNSENDIVV